MLTDFEKGVKGGISQALAMPGSRKCIRRTKAVLMSQAHIFSI